MSDKTSKTEPDKVETSLSLRDDDIHTGRGLSRRGLLRGAGGTAIGAVALTGVSTGAAEAGTDVDNGPRTDPGGQGRGYCRSYRSNVTDSDNGNWRDPGGNGRGGPGAQARYGYTDRDNGTWTDPGGQGRGVSRALASGITDIDQGNCSDPGGNGRG